jgi:hypothetical protein
MKVNLIEMWLDLIEIFGKMVLEMIKMTVNLTSKFGAGLK